MITKKLPLVFLIISVLLFTAGLMTAQDIAESPPANQDFIAKAGTMPVPVLSFGVFKTAPTSLNKYEGIKNYFTEYALWVGGIDNEGKVFVISGDGNEKTGQPEWYAKPERTDVKFDYTSLSRSISVQTAFSDEKAYKGHQPKGLEVTQIMTYTGENKYVDYNYKVTNKSELPLSKVFIGVKMFVKTPGPENKPYNSKTNILLTSNSRIPFIVDSKTKNSNTDLIGLVPSSENPAYFNFWKKNNRNKLSDQDKYRLMTGEQSSFASAANSENVILVSSGPFNLAPGQSIDFSTSIVHGDNENEFERFSRALSPNMKLTNHDQLELSKAAIIDDALVPQEYKLVQNFPNPFNPVTTIKFHLVEKANVELTVYDILGKEVTSLFNDQKPAGVHSLIWNGKNSAGKKVSSGVYLYKIKVSNSGGLLFQAVKRMVLIK